jgi:L-threonylcarbamoyladenylate synthase
MPAGPAQIARAARRLNDGGLVAFPTETVYGLGADAMNVEAVGKVFALKGRSPDKPLILHVSGRTMASGLVEQWPDDAQKLVEAFWPGSLTLVLPKAPHVPDIVTGGGDTVAVRCPAHQTTIALIETFDGPLVGPSANPSGTVSPTTAEHVRAAFSAEDVMVLDGGPCLSGIESTVLRMVGDELKMLRRGPIGGPVIARLLGRTIIEPGEGHFAPQYAPRASAVVFEPEHWSALVRQVERDGIGRTVLVTHRDRRLPSPHVVMRLPHDARNYAAAFYAALRRADELNPLQIAIEHPPKPDEALDEQAAAIWKAVADRVEQAADTFTATDG